MWLAPGDCATVVSHSDGAISVELDLVLPIVCLWQGTCKLCKQWLAEFSANLRERFKCES
jgi:hypothetical protein